MTQMTGSENVQNGKADMVSLHAIETLLVRVYFTHTKNTHAHILSIKYLTTSSRTHVQQSPVTQCFSPVNYRHQDALIPPMAVRFGMSDDQ